MNKEKAIEILNTEIRCNLSLFEGKSEKSDLSNAVIRSVIEKTLALQKAVDALEMMDIE